MDQNKKKLFLKINGMSCANCAVGIKKHLESNGLENVNINFTTREASYSIKDNQSEKDIVNLIKELGYTIEENLEKGNLSKVEKYTINFHNTTFRSYVYYSKFYITF